MLFVIYNDVLNLHNLEVFVDVKIKLELFLNSAIFYITVLICQSFYLLYYALSRG